VHYIAGSIRRLFVTSVARDVTRKQDRKHKQHRAVFAVTTGLSCTP